VSDLKLQGLAEQIPSSIRREIVAELKLDLKLASFTLTSSTPPGGSSRGGTLAKLALVEEHMRRSGQIGNLESKSGYFKAEAEMDWFPLDDKETVLFCGYVGSLLLALGGSISHLLGQPRTQTQLGSQPYTIRAAIHGVGLPRPGDLGRDLLAAAHVAYVTPQPVRVLAGVITRGKLPRGSVMTDYILATPIYVETIIKSAG
jgi:hypothetical protein